jgi:hypothetical protein
MAVNVLIANVVTLHPFSEVLVTNLKPGTLYTYHLTSNRDGKIWIFIDQTQDWYPLDWFKSNKLCYN